MAVIFFHLAMWLTMAVTFSLPALLPFAYLAVGFLVAPAAYYAMIGKQVPLTHAVRQVMIDDGLGAYQREVGTRKTNGDFNDSHNHVGNKYEENECAPAGNLTKSKYCFWNPTRMTNALRAQLFFKRLNAYAVFSVLACAVILMPLYLGEGYNQVLQRVVVASCSSGCSSGCLASGSCSSYGPPTCRSQARSHTRCRSSFCRSSMSRTSTGKG